MKALRIDHKHQHGRHRQAQRQACERANHRPGRAFAGHHGQDLPTRQAQVRQQAKLLAPRQHLRAETGRHAEQTNRNRHALQPVGHGKAAVKNLQRRGANLADRRHLQQRAAARRLGIGQPAQGLLHVGVRHLAVQPQRYVVDAPVAAQALEVALRHGNRAKLAGIVAPHAGHVEFLICY